MSEPQCLEIEIEAFTGGKVQIVQYKLTNDFSFRFAEKYSIPAFWDEDQVNAFRLRKTEELKQRVDEFAQIEQDALLQSSDWYRG